MAHTHVGFYINISGNRADAVGMRAFEGHHTQGVLHRSKWCEPGRNLWIPIRPASEVSHGLTTCVTYRESLLAFCLPYSTSSWWMVDGGEVARSEAASLGSRFVAMVHWPPKPCPTDSFYLWSSRVAPPSCLLRWEDTGGVTRDKFLLVAMKNL